MTTYQTNLELYEKIVAQFPEIERKGKTMPYTSANGYMFSLLNKAGELGFRFSKERQKVLIGNFKKSKINYFYSASSRPKICARYFGDIGRDHLNAQLKIVKIHTKATVSEARFQIRIYQKS